MHPRHAAAFEWDDDRDPIGNIAELAAHRIHPWEVEEVFFNDPTWVPNKHSGAGEWKMVGRTDGGRRLTVVVTVNRFTGDLRPITGWDSTTGERTRYPGRRT